MKQKPAITTFLKILVSGSHGFVGKSLVSFLKQQGHEVIALCRLSPIKKQTGGVFWNPSLGEFEREEFEGFDAIIHLAGESIAGGLWTRKKKASIQLSRIRDTRLLAEIIASLKKPPKTFLCASAIGFYGDRGNEMLNEDSPAGEGFLAGTCVQWEEASLGAKTQSTRVVNMRFGHILSPLGGILKKMLPVYRLGFGGSLGKKEQIISWIALDDVIGGINHCLKKANLSGPVNFTSPYPVIQDEFVKTLAASLKRPAFLHIPYQLVKWLTGEMGKELLLSSILAYPEVLVRTGYTFQYPHLEEVFSENSDL